MSKSYFNLFIDVRTLEEIKSTATIVIDTNVLLMGYQWKDITFDSVLKVLKQLSDDGRLKIPAHVIREFAKNRPGKIEEMYKQIHTVKSNLEKGSKNGNPLNEVIPALPILQRNHNDILTLEKKYNECIEELNKARKEYMGGLNQLQRTLCDYIDRDLILNSYKEIIEKSYFEPDGLMNETALQDNWNKRVEGKIPPGYMDKNKPNNKYGDLIIWDHICQINNDVIFVTADVKEDWVHIANGEVMGARRELVEEFNSRNQAPGYTFKILTPLQFVTIFSAENIEAEIQDDLTVDNLISQEYIKTRDGKLSKIEKHKMERNRVTWHLFNKDTIKSLRRLVDKEEPIFQQNLDNLESNLDIIWRLSDYDEYRELNQEYINLLEFILSESIDFIEKVSEVDSLVEKFDNVVKRIMS
ncbi:hypothetical protein CN391_05340 [Bacillus anthracis]|nr:hypothetical protein CN391_05340 [Bacillus anthracis]